jgi:predicted TIM-barrel fold metal-dependent hydrolase
MIDVHVHVTNAKLPGIKAEHPMLDGPEMPLADLLKAEMKQAGVDQILAMGRLNAPASDPLGIAGILRLAGMVPGLHAIGAIDPTKTSADHLRGVESALKAGKVKALKAYLGYLHHGPDSPGYQPYYELAEKYQLPVVFHTGDTYSTTAKLRYAHPLLVDDVAVDHPKVRFVMAHFGNPWLTDAAAVVYKNPNVWADLSGLIVGDEALFQGHFQARRPILEINDAILDVRKAFQYTGKPERFLFGSDWPLAPMASYRKLVEAIIPKESHQAVFEDNARELFGLS